MKFRIWAEVSGGVTGNRSAWAKDNGVIAEYATREEAQAEADAMNRTMNNPKQNYHATGARYRYTVKEVE